MEAIKHLHFEPSQTARAMRTNRTMTVGVVLPTLLNPYFPSLVHSIKNRLWSYEYTTVVLDTDLDPRKERDAVVILRRQRVDGVILVSVSKAKFLVNMLTQVGIPVVLVDEGITSLQVDQVTVDHYKGAKEAMEWAKRYGHTNIGHLAGSRNAKSANLRLHAYLDVMGWKRFNLEEIENHSRLPIICADYDFDKGRDATKILLDKHPRLTCLFAANDTSALGALYYLSSQRKRVPDDIAIIGFDDIQMASLVHPSLTTIKQPVDEIGEVGAQLLLERIEERIECIKNPGIKPNPAKQITFSPVLVPRESC